MWDLPHLVQLKKARNALKKGRLDEAWEIATDEAHRDYRQCQDLLDQLVPALLERARSHLEAQRPDDALADIARAREAGGQQTEIASLREEVLAHKKSARDARRHTDEVARSVRGHLEAGRLTEGARRLEQSPTASSETAGLERELKRRRFEVDQALLQVGRLLDEGDVGAALDSADILGGLAPEEPRTQVILAKIARECEKAVSQAFENGAIARGAALLRKIDAVQVSGFDCQRWKEVSVECHKAAAAIAQGDWSKVRLHVARLRRLLPDAQWLVATENDVRVVEDAVRDIRTGPLGALSSAPGEPTEADDATPAAAFSTLETIAAQLVTATSSPSPLANDPQRACDARQFVLWVDGVGSFLLVQGERTTIGRQASSAAPDIALPADIDGVHAEILRVDHDYFLVPRARTKVGGQTVTRRLLSNGDEIDLAGRFRLTFRLPSAMSSTALLELPRDQRLENDVRRIILEDGHVIFGATTACHVETPHAPERVILSTENGEFRCRHDGGVVVDGYSGGANAPVPPGSHVEAGDLTFTITPLVRKGGKA